MSDCPPSHTPSVLRCGSKQLQLDAPLVMGILNVTPDSFSDGGRFDQFDTALVQADAMIQAGAHIIDVGGESTRPGAAGVDEQQELDRVLPIIQAIRDRFDTVVSIDTSKAAVMREAAAVGAGMINDVRALRQVGALSAAVETGLPVCLMHMQGDPVTMQMSPEYDDVVAEVTEFLLAQRERCVNAGMDVSQIVLDPGFGFGKTLTHNLVLLDRLVELCRHGPVLAGLSRKRMFAEILGSESVSRVTASVSAALLCVQNGASIVRVHDVAPTVEALAVYSAVRRVQH